MKRTIILNGIKATFGIDPMDVTRNQDGAFLYVRDEKDVSVSLEADLGEILEKGISDNDFYTWGGGTTHDFTRLRAIHILPGTVKTVDFVNGSNSSSGYAYEAPIILPSDDLHLWFKENICADLYIVYHSERDSNGQEDEWMTVYVPTKRSRRKMLFKIHEQYKKFVDEINELLDNHAGTDEYISKLVQVENVE